VKGEGAGKSSTKQDVVVDEQDMGTALGHGSGDYGGVRTTMGQTSDKTCSNEWSNVGRHWKAGGGS